MKRSLIIGAAWILLAACAAVQATTLQRLSLEELAAASPAIARVRCLSNQSRIEGGRIWTWTVLEVSEPLKGALPQRITLRLLGGKVGGLISKVEGVPRFTPQEEVILFLQPTRSGDWTVVSWVQGTFRIAREKSGDESVTQDTAGVVMFDPATRRFVAGSVRNQPLHEFKAQLARALARGAGGQR